MIDTTFFSLFTLFIFAFAYILFSGVERRLRLFLTSIFVVFSIVFAYFSDLSELYYITFPHDVFSFVTITIFISCFLLLIKLIGGIKYGKNT